MQFTVLTLVAVAAAAPLLESLPLVEGVVPAVDGIVPSVGNLVPSLTGSVPAVGGILPVGQKQPSQQYGPVAEQPTEEEPSEEEPTEEEPTEEDPTEEPTEDEPIYQPAEPTYPKKFGEGYARQQKRSGLLSKPSYPTEPEYPTEQSPEEQPSEEPEYPVYKQPIEVCPADRTPLCCQMNALEVAALTCEAPTKDVFFTKKQFTRDCAASGLIASCCKVDLISGIALLCN